MSNSLKFGHPKAIIEIDESVMRRELLIDNISRFEHLKYSWNYVQTIEEEKKKAKQSDLRLQMMYITTYTLHIG